MIVYQIIRDEDGYLVAHILLDPKSAKITEFRGYEKTYEFHDPIRELYGSDATYIPKREFQQELEKRTLHTPEMIALLKDNYMGEDLSSYIVYGSPNRPMSSWARIDGAVYLTSNVRETGYHSYVAVPAILAKEVIESFELVFVSRPAVAE